MTPFKRTVLSSITLALLGISSAQAADTQALEKRIKELESRVEKLDRANAF